MSYYAHDVRLMSRFVDGILHGLAVERHRFVLLPPRVVPGIERPIQRVGFNAHQAIANHKFAGHDIVSVLTPTAEAFAGLLSQAIGSVGDGLVTARAAQRRACCDAQHHRQAMAPPLSAARIGNECEALRQRTHLFGIEHDLGGSGQL